jgi:RNA polymerase sigma-70 factor (ECF subfamily)
MGEVQDADVDAGTAGDLESLYRDQGARVWRAVFAYAGSRDVADDAVAEAFAQALRRGAAIRDPLAWIWRAAFRIAAGELKRRRAHVASDYQGTYELTETRSDLAASLAKLSPNQRAAVVLHHYAGYRSDEVAGIIGSTPAAVRVHLMRGRRRLRELLEEHDDRS